MNSLNPAIELGMDVFAFVVAAAIDIVAKATVVEVENIVHY